MTNERSESRGAYKNARFFARARLGANDDFDVAVERGEEMHQPLHGETLQAVIGQRGNLGLIDFQAAGRCYLGEFLARDDLIDRDRQPCFRLLLLRIRKMQIGENVAGTPSNVPRTHCLTIPVLGYIRQGES